MSSKSRKIVVFAGPTACGKSAAALDFARANNGAIINADSQQVYAEVPLLSAAPSMADRESVPHKLYGFLRGDEQLDVVKWCRLAVAEIEAAWAARLQPVLVGGTGFYLKVLMEGVSPIPAAEWAVGATYEELLQCDPESAVRINPSDRQRIERAVGVFRLTGKTLSHFR
ncbi:MAG: tRNA (adenosine(37)-N6)-dimethylallyltransferase MiaA, partial [Alphaproteobacteria bacterium]|nr:tRNA (adenosine(37)-N6)-dimethylallyltransferase MiaA [Alphaproteobacteria bacterium]